MFKSGLFTFFFFCIGFSLLAKGESCRYHHKDSTYSKKFTYRGFSGGMLLHTGYASGHSLALSDQHGNSVNLKVAGPIFGIGGRIALHFGNHWRFGSEGYVTTVYSGDKEEFEIGWGGLLADYQLHFGKWHPFFGLTIGGGSAKHRYNMGRINENSDTDQIYWQDYGLFILNPFVGVEYALSNKIRLIAKADYMLSPTAMVSRPDFAMGPRIYLGVIFCK